MYDTERNLDHSLNSSYWLWLTRFRQLVDFCYDVREWLNSDPENIVAMHCKGGKGTDISYCALWVFQNSMAELSVGRKVYDIRICS